MGAAQNGFSLVIQQTVRGLGKFLEYGSKSRNETLRGNAGEVHVESQRQE